MINLVFGLFGFIYFSFEVAFFAVTDSAAARDERKQSKSLISITHEVRELTRGFGPRLSKNRN